MPRVTQPVGGGGRCEARVCLPLKGYAPALALFPPHTFPTSLPPGSAARAKHGHGGAMTLPQELQYSDTPSQGAAAWARRQPVTL